MNVTTNLPAGKRYLGPHPGILAIVYIVLFMASIILFSVFAHGATFPSPFSDLGKFQQLVKDFPAALKANALLQVASAMPLGIFTAAIVSKTRSLGVMAAGPNLALFGGITASLFVSLSGVSSWIIAQPGVIENVEIVRVLRLLGFATGGITHAMALGLLMAGIAVPCLLRKYTPAWMAWLGIILGFLAQLSMFGLVLDSAFILLPIVRFGSYIWMVSTGFSLMKNK